MKLKGAMLLYAMVTSMLFITGSIAFISFTGLNTKVADQWMEKEFVMEKALNGIIAGKGESSSRDGSVKERSWGMFYLVNSEFSKNQSRYSFTAFTAGSENPGFSMYVADQGKPIHIGSPVKLEGKIFIPGGSARRSYVSRPATGGTWEITNQQLSSNATVPPLDEKLVRNNLRYLKGEYEPGDSIIYITSIPDSLVNSFNSNTLLTMCEGNISISRQVIMNNVIVSTGGSCYIGKDAVIENALIYAKNIYVEDGFNGCLHLVASDTLILGHDVNLRFPSTVLVLRGSASPDKILLRAGKNTSINGFAGGWENSSRSIQRLLVSFDEGSSVNGFLYSSGMLSFQGRLTGALATRMLMLSTPSGTFEHHIQNAVVLAERDSALALMSFLNKSASKREIIKWL